MVASRTATAQTPADTAAEIIAGIEDYAANGDWELVEQAAAQLRHAVLQVAEGERRHTVLAALRSMENVQALAQQARNNVKEKLTVIRRGQDATAAYTNSD